jgi:hypothetical protein
MREAAFSMLHVVGTYSRDTASVPVAVTAAAAQDASFPAPTRGVGQLEVASPEKNLQQIIVKLEIGRRPIVGKLKCSS